LKIITLGLVSAFALVGCTVDDQLGQSEQQSAASGVAPTLLARGTYGAFTVETEGAVPLEMKTTASVDVVVRKHSYNPGGYTGWHTHPGPVLITVTKGAVEFIEADTCESKIVTAGQGYVDTGHGHYGRNASATEPAEDHTVIFAPVGAPFRGELPAGLCGL
jgi:hypothetical protein